MNVGGILDFKPEVNAKRGVDDDDIATSVPAAKVRRKLKEIEKSRKDLPFEQLTDEEKLKMLQAAESDVAVNPLSGGSDGLEGIERVAAVDIGAMKKTILSFQKKVNRNQEARIKFPDNPEKFMETELELHDEIVEMRAIATQPEIYPLLLSSETGALRTILTTINHDNTDISIAVIELLNELSDVDTLNESVEGAKLLVEELSEFRVVSILVQNMERLDENNSKEEAQAVFNSLGIIENILEFKPELSFDVSSSQGLMTWLLKRLKLKTGGDAAVKSYASEILAILLQNSDEVKRQLGEADGGIDTLLQLLSQFKRRDPASSEDGELMENTFNCLCSALLPPSGDDPTPNNNRHHFLEGEGLQLMNLLLREKKRSRFGALKVLNYALSGSEGADNCMKWVDILGLRTIFPLFMKPPVITKSCGYTTEQCEEHIISIIAWLLRNLPDPSSESGGSLSSNQKARVLNKFFERECEKTDRLMELHFKYYQFVRNCDVKIDAQRQKFLAEGADEEEFEELEEEFYLQRLDAGLFTLQLVDYIIVEASRHDKRIAEKIHTALKLRGHTKDSIRDVIREYASRLGDARSEDEREEEQKRLISLVDAF